MKLSLRLFFACFFCNCIILSFSSAYAQSIKVSGTLVDTVSYSEMLNTSVSFLRSSDSVLVNFTRADEQGKFSLELPAAGDYVILVVHPNFADYFDVVKVSENKSDIGSIQMTSKQTLLQEVIINDARAITIKGDTTEYTADSFKVREFATVDELLKKLPGIQVDKNGNITAHGEKVQKMYVDGEEFFADDPAMVAKTLRASAVDKVQVYDKKSDQAEFTGIDDGEKIKTINLKLKDNAKQGYFGKVSAGGGLPGYWENQAMINAFKGKRKLAAYGVMSNTNNTGLNWDDNSKYSSGGGSVEVNDDGDFMMTGNNSDEMSDWGGSYNGMGLPKAWKAGALYTNKFFEDALNLNLNYQFSKGDIQTDNNTRTQYVLPDTQYVNNSFNSSFSSRQKHNANVTADYKIDSMQSIKINVSGNVSQSMRVNDNNSNSVTLSGSQINASNQHQQIDGTGNNIDASILYRKKFKKDGRTISLNLTGTRNEQETTGNYLSINEFNTLGLVDTINQKKDINTESIKFGGTLTYTEKLSKVAALEFNYGLSVNNNKSSNYTYDQDESGQVSNVFNPLFSSDYDFNILTNRLGSNLRLKYNQITLTLGGAVANADFKQYDKIYDTTINYSYLNFFPRAIFRYSKNRQLNLTFSYNGNTQQPTISQLQPLRQNTDPLNISIGNPDLKQAFNHNFNLNFGNYKVLQERYMWAGMGFNLMQNAISQSQTINEAGIRTYQYINVDGNYNAYAYIGYGFKIKPLDLDTRLNFNGNFSHNNTMLNGEKTTSLTQSYTPGLSLNYSLKDTILNINYDINVGYNRSTTTVRPDFINDYWSVTQEFGTSYDLTHGFLIGTNVDWLYRQKIDEQDKNNSVFRWNAYLQKSLLKDRSLVIKLYVNDILNQNIGFQRSAYDNYVTESQYNTIRRYGMISLTWNFTHSAAMSGGSSEPAQDIEIQQD